MAEAMPIDDERRDRLLRALGITPYRLRTRTHTIRNAANDAAVAPHADMAADMATGSSPIDCVLVLPAGSAPRCLDLVGRAMHAFGVAFARAPRIEVVDGRLGVSPPQARAYLAFGEAQARALGRELPAAITASAHVVLLDDPRQLLDGAGKRRLWSALCALRRALRDAAVSGG